jgi:hypothetical protein
MKGFPTVTNPCRPMCLILTVTAPAGEREELEAAARKATAAGLRYELGPLDER